MILKIDSNTRLELISSEHALQVYDLVSANRLYLRQWLPWVDNMKSVEFIENFVKGSADRNKAGSEFAFVIIENENIAGRVGIYKIDHQNKIGEIGYWVGENVQGKGIVTKSCRALIDFCFNELNLNRIEIKCGVENTKSQAIPIRLQFFHEGIIRQGELVHGKFIDLNSYSLLKTDSQNKP